MLSHKHIWSAIDGLASRYGHSPSGLARAAGLDPTTFNKSKRLGPQGRLRWPSTESIAKILQVTGASFEEFTALVSRTSRPASRVLPLLNARSAARKKDAFDADGKPNFKAWDQFPFPDLGDEEAFAVEIGTGAASFPADSTVVVSPRAEIGKGDTVVVRVAGRVFLAKFLRQTAKRVSLKEFGPKKNKTRTLERSGVLLMARAVWLRL